jgi:general secretion pathway protein E
VLATVHTNDAPSSVTRLIDMGVEPFLLSSSLLGVLAQRLVRKLCPRCRRQDAQGYWHPVGCEHCAHTGYKGRTGVYELMAVDATVQALVHNRAAESDLATAARAAGLRSMREDGERLVAEGVTSLEELVRVTRESDLPGSEAMNRRTAARAAG